MLEVHRLERTDGQTARRWDSFVHACPDATFFHLSAWQGIFEQSLKHDAHYLYATRDGEIVGVLPLVEVKTVFFGHTLASLPYLAYGGVAALDNQTAMLLEEEADKLARRQGVAHLELRQLSRSHAEWPRLDNYVTFRKSIEPTAEANLLAIPRKQRAMVRKGIKQGLVARFDQDVERFYRLYANGMHRHGTPALSKRYFADVKRTFGDACSVLTVESAQGQPLSTVLSFYFRDEVIPYYAGDDEAARDLAANDFKYWELMRDACARGLKTFDYGRSKVGTGSHAFKKNWGFEPQALHYEFMLYKRETVPQNNPSNRKYRYMIEAWRHLPRPMVNWLGPYVVRGLG